MSFSIIDIETMECPHNKIIDISIFNTDCNRDAKRIIASYLKKMKNNLERIKKITIYIMAFSYMAVGITHFINPSFFMQIMPPYLPWHLELVYLSGIFEIVLGFLLIFTKTRRWAAWGLIGLLIAVFPANIYLAQSSEAQQALAISRTMAIIRLPFQLLFLGIAYWFTRK